MGRKIKLAAWGKREKNSRGSENPKGNFASTGVRPSIKGKRFEKKVQSREEKTEGGG